MAVVVINENYTTKIYTFGYDNWNSDGDKLPRIGIRGKDNLNTIKSCSQNSIAIGTDGSKKILKGSTNEWVDYAVNNGNSGNGDIQYSYVTKSDIDSLFE